MKSFPAVVLLGFGLAGCKATVKTHELEKVIEAHFAEQGMPGKASCPEGAEAKAGATFVCKLEIEHTTYDVNVKVNSVDMSTQANVVATLAGGDALRRQFIVDNMQKEIRKVMDLPATIDCGTAPLIFPERSQVKCNVTMDGAHSTLIITLEDNLDVKQWQLDPPLINRAKFETAVQNLIADKLGSTQVSCGEHAVLARPADGEVRCAVTYGKDKGTLVAQLTSELAITVVKLVDK